MITLSESQLQEYQQQYSLHTYNGNLAAMVEIEQIFDKFSVNAITVQCLFRSALNNSCYIGRLDVVQHLVKKINNQLEIEEDIADYIYYSTDSGNIKLVKFFVENYAVKDLSFFSKALEHAARYAKLDILQYLVSKGGDIYAENNKLVRKAVMHNHFDIVKFLVDNGSNPFAKGNEALKEASKHGYVEILAYLVENGGDIEIVKKHAREKTNNWLTEKFAQQLEDSLTVTTNERQRMKI